MVDANLFDDLEHIARFLRPKQRNTPWGGIQPLVAGDFYQLPPVKIRNLVNDDELINKVYAFEADCWDSSFDLQMVLVTVFRQLDPQLVKLLHGVRNGECDSDDTTTEPDESVEKALRN